MKKALSLVLALVMVFALVACGGSNTGSSSDNGTAAEAGTPAVTPDAANTDTSNVANDPHVTLVYAEVNPLDTIVGQTGTAFKEKVEELSGGSITIDIQAGGVLGSENDVLDSMVGGSNSIDISRISAFALTSYGAKKSMLLSIPYTFVSREHWWNFANSDLAPEFLNEPQEIGLPLRGIFYGEEGFRHFFTKPEVKSMEDLKGLKQLPGLAAQLLMAEGYGFGAEGDWKHAALTRLLKIMAHNDRTVFMEDYTLDLRKGHEAILGAHMLEVDPTIASDKPKVEVHPLDIGGKDDPARLVFTGAEGKAVDVTVADFRDGFRLIYYPVDCRKAEAETPHLPVAKQLWTPTVGLKKGSEEWMRAGGGHHTVLSFTLTPEQLHDLGVMLGMELVEIL